MQVVVHLESRKFIFKDIIVPITVLQIKQRLFQCFDVPVRHQRLLYYPDEPQQGPGLRLCKDYDRFVQGTQKTKLVLALGEVSIWAHFYVYLPSDSDEKRRVSKVNANRFNSIADVKQCIIDGQGLQVNGLSKQAQNGNLLNENTNLFQCKVENGTILCCV